jgi:hypothetical protein
MAFCPHCGKSVTEQASKCLACGQEFEPRAKAARFKGTMMMQPGAASAAQAAGAAKPAPAAKPVEPAKPAAAAGAAPMRAPTPAPSKVGKGTMLGTGGAGLAPPPGRPSAQSAQPAVAKPPPAAGVPARATAPGAAPPPKAKAPEPDLALAQTARMQTEPELDTPSGPPGPEDSQRFLVGDPMAPAATTSTGKMRTASRSFRLETTDQPKTGTLITIGVAGMLLIAGVGYATAKYLGLLN